MVNQRGQEMILPTKGIPPQRSLLAVGAQVLSILDEPLTVSQAWLRLKAWRDEHSHRSTLPFWWFALSLDVLYAIGLLEMQNDLLVRVNRSA
ncbi:ABC-three component system middle component 6 [Pseudonocardia spinosispora]|uniref:ABC-three component system middle component 6 n=1 Tax=Pseudonocardia spinosispora TaxID=103441 RepID=UPI003CCBA122